MGTLRLIRKRRAAGIGVACLALVLGALSPAQAAPGASLSPEPGSGYIVVLDGAPSRSTVAAQQVRAQAEALAHRFGQRVEHTYHAALRGFSVRLSHDQAKELAADPAVSYVVPDGPVRALGEQLNPPSWGLDRIDQRQRPLDARYRYVTEAATVHAYVIDTGVWPNHQDFEGRVSGGYDFVDNDPNPVDGHGHGTFVAGIIGGKLYGVAKKVRIVPVRVLNNSGSGTYAGVIAGVDWVTQHAAKPAVANMSLGGSANVALDSAVRTSILSGVQYSVPSGSSAGDAANFSPARVREALTVSASNTSDCAAPFSNYGPLIDLYAPGVSITGPWITSDTASVTMSGGSFATAHVSGGAALYVADHPTATAAQVHAAVVNNASAVVCSVPPNTTNRLLYTLPS